MERRRRKGEGEKSHRKAIVWKCRLGEKTTWQLLSITLASCQWGRKQQSVDRSSPFRWAAPIAADGPALKSPGKWATVHVPRLISLIAPHWRCYSNITSDTFLFVLSLSGYRRAAFKPQQIASVTLNACEQIALWNRKRAPAATSASRLWLESSLHYTSSKTYPLFMDSYFNTISTLHNHPPKYLHVSNQRSDSSQSNFARAEINELGLRKWRRLHHTRLDFD